MRSWRVLLLLSGLAACHFSVDAVDFASSGPSDMAVPGNHDMPATPDLAARKDMACGVAGCMFGCLQTPTPHCRGLVPSGVVTAADYTAKGLTAQSTTADVIIDTGSGAISGGITRPAGTGVVNGIGFRVATQINGPSVGVFGVAGLMLASGQKVSFTGSNAFALASNGNVTIAGTLDGSCSLGVVGPGGSGGGTGLVAGGIGSGLGGGGGGATAAGGASGGGGGGFGDVGGTGAVGNGTPTTSGGVIWPNVMGGTVILVGGSGGGAGGGLSGGNGGGGGGAIQLSVNGNLMVSGTIDVSGCGGAHPTAAGMAGGGGGGSGGAIVLEAAQLALTPTSVVSSNGGGGGGGGDNSGSDGADGMAGQAPAVGGMAGGGGGGVGGEGGSRGTQAGIGNTQGQNAPPKAGVKFGGGGGGGTGRILFRALMVNAQAKTISPDFGDNNANNQKMTISQTATFQ